MSDELRQQIESTAASPKRVRTDAGEVESQDIAKLIEVDKYLSGSRAVKAAHRGLRFSKIVPPGTT